MKKNRIVAFVVIIFLLTVNPAFAFECWYANDPTIWELPVELLIWYLYWTIPQLYNQMPYFDNMNDALIWLVNTHCSFTQG